MKNTESAVDVRRIYQALALEQDLDGVDLRVFLYLFARLDFTSFTQVPQVEIAEALGRRKQHVSRSLAKLNDKGVVIAGPKIARVWTGRLNPNYGK
jgi:predicted transcriptional regulator